MLRKVRSWCEPAGRAGRWCLVPSRGLQVWVPLLLVMSATSLLAEGGVLWSWGGNIAGLSTVPEDLTNVVCAAAGGRHSVALREDGYVVAWGDDNKGQTRVPADAMGAIAVAAGREHTLVLREDGRVLAWGSDAFGQSTVPPDLTNVIAVAAGAAHSVALKQDGSLVFWGDNSYGQSSVPDELGEVIAISAGRNHNLALRPDGTVLAWGKDDWGQTLTPAGLSNVIAVAAGGYHCLALRNDGTVEAWGANNFGQSTPPAGLTNVVAIAAGDDFSLAVRRDGEVVAWQQEIYGAASVPEGLTNGVLVSAGLTHSLALAADRPVGFVYPRNPLVPAGEDLLLQLHVHWRSALSYQWYHNGLILPEATHRSLRVEAFHAGLAGRYECRVTDADAAESSLFTTAYLLDPGIVVTQPMDARVPPGQDVVFTVSASCGTNLVYQWRKDGVPLEESLTQLPPRTDTLTVPAAQGNEMGFYDVMVQCGYHAAVSRPAALIVEPVAVWGRNGWAPVGLDAAVAVAAGDTGNLALREDGTVWEWNGAEPLAGQQAPVFGVIQISAGTAHQLALLTDGTVAAWGDNRYGQTSVPSGLSNVIAVAAGAYHSLALKDDGGVVAWGANFSGQTEVPFWLSGVTAIAAGWYHNLALLGDGTLVAWGASFSAQTSVPVGLDQVIAIGAGGHHSLAVRNDGTVVAWGEDEQGQIDMPPDLNSVVQVAAGAYHSIAIRSNGTSVAWGENRFQQGRAPTTLTNVVSLGANGDHNIALMRPVPRPWIHPYLALGEPGDTLTLRANVSWWGPLTYAWEHAGVPLPNATNRWLELTNLTLADFGEYRCRVQSAAGVEGIASTTVFLHNPDLVNGSPTSQWTRVGSTLQLAVSSACTEDATYQWRKDGQPLVEEAGYEGTTSNLLTIVASSEQRAGSYDVLIRCGHEAAISPPAQVQVGQALALAWDPVPESGVAGYRAYLGLRSREYAVVADVGLATNHTFQGLADGTLYYLAVTAYDTNANPSDFSEEVFHLTPGLPAVPLEPEILEHPTDQTVRAGSNATFRVTATGAGTLLYQWQKNGVQLADNEHFQGVNQAELRVTRAGGNEVGIYSVLVTNVLSSAASTDARLRVYVPPALQPPVTLPDGTTLLSIVNSDGSAMTGLQVYRYWIEACTNLSPSDWGYLDLPMSFEEGVLRIEDSQSLSLPQRFFRAGALEDSAVSLHLQPPQPLGGGVMRLCLECNSGLRPLTPFEVSRITVEASGEALDTTEWVPLAGPAQWVDGRLVIDDHLAAGVSPRFYRAYSAPSPATAPIRLRSEVRETNGTVRLLLSRQGGQPLTPAEVFNYEVLVSADPLGATDWTLLSVPMQLTNGTLQLIDPSTNGPRFYRVYAR